MRTALYKRTSRKTGRSHHGRREAGTERGGFGSGCGRCRNVDDIHNLKNFVTKTVCNVIHYDSTACLTLRRTPNGEIIQGVGWQNGDPIKVHKTYKLNGWYFAYHPKTNKYGYVNPNNVK